MKFRIRIEVTSPRIEKEFLAPRTLNNMGESMAIFPEDIYESRKASNNLDYRVFQDVNRGLQNRNASFAHSTAQTTQHYIESSSNSSVMLPGHTVPGIENNNAYPPVTSQIGLPPTSVPTLSEIESMMYAHVGQRLMFASENNNRPVPAIHYQYVTSTGLLVERPGSPMVQRSVLQEANPIPQESYPKYVSSPIRLNPGYIGIPQLHGEITAAQESKVPLSQGQFIHRPLPEYYVSPAYFEHIQRPSRPKAPSPDSIHKDLLLPPDATDAEVERNLRSKVQTAAMNMGSSKRELTLSPPGIFHGQNIPGIFLTQTSIPQTFRQNTFVTNSSSLGYGSPMISGNMDNKIENTYTTNVEQSNRSVSVEDGKMKVTDLDQDLEYEQDTRSTRPESPVPDLIDDTRSGQPVQQISVITALPDLLKENNADCMRRVVPKVREVLYVAGQDMQLAACSSFLQTLQNKLVPIPSYTSTFLQTIITSLNNKDPDIANAWLETLLDVIDLLPKDVIKKEILTVAISKGQLSQAVQSRLTCCQILGKIATKFEPFVIKKDILPIVQSLCQDVDYEVRACMCRQLDPVARGLGLEQTKSAILPELLELTNDEEGMVRLAGIETVVKILTLLDDETRTNTIIPLVCKFCQQSLYKEDLTLPFVAKQIGKLAHELQTNLTDEQKRWFVDYFKKICRLGVKDSDRPNHKDTDSDPSHSKQDGEDEVDQTVETRQNAAFNFPAMVLFVGSKHFKAELFQTLNSLVSDPDSSVRKSVGMGFHEVVKALHNNCFLILNDLMTLFRDDSLEVFQGVVSYMPETLESYCRCLHNSTTNVEAKQAALQQDLVIAMLQCEAVISNSNNWRLQALFLEKLSCLPNCYPSELIYTKFIPLLFKRLTKARALPVKLAAGKTLLVLCRNIERLDQREEICSRLIEDLCSARSCYLRCLFIDICNLIMDNYSKAFFKEYFFEFLLRLSRDRVPNVRMKLCKLFPRLKKQIKLPKDRNLLQQLETCVRNLLMSEKDKDTYEILEQAVKDFDKITVLVESVTKKAHTEEDLLDAQKEEHEKFLIAKEEREKEDEAKQVKTDKKKEQSNKKDAQTKPPASKRGSKVPPATSITKPTAITAGGVRTERSGSFAGSSSSNSTDKKSSTNKTSRSGRSANTASPAPNRVNSKKLVVKQKN